MLLFTGCGSDGNHGCFGADVVADLDGHNLFVAARLEIHDVEKTLFELSLGMVLVSVSEDAIQLLVASFDLVVRHLCNPKLKSLQLGIG